MDMCTYALFSSPLASPSPSPSASISNRFQDIPEPIRGKITKAVKDAVRESLREVAKEIQLLSLDKDPNTTEKVKRLKAEVEAAARLGFDVNLYKERLTEIEYMLDGWQERMERLEDLSARMMLLRMEMEIIDKDEEKEWKDLGDIATRFNSVASAPWRSEKL